MKDLERIIADMALADSKSKDAWAEACMIKLLPPVLVKWANEKKNQKYIAKFLQKQKIRMVQMPDNSCRMMRGNQVVGTWKSKYSTLKKFNP